MKRSKWAKCLVGLMIISQSLSVMATETQAVPQEQMQYEVGVEAQGEEVIAEQPPVEGVPTEEVPNEGMTEEQVSENGDEGLTTEDNTGSQELDDDQTETLPEVSPETDFTKVIMTLGSTDVLLYGQPVTLLAAPKVIGGRTYLPLRFVGEEILKASIVWDPAAKQITVNNGQIEIVLFAGNTKALVNGVEMTIDAPPVIENGVTLLPVRFMAEQFGLQIDFDEKTKRIEISEGVPPVPPVPNTPPTAMFAFENTDYVAGQVVKAIDQSVDVDGDQITETLWMINGDPKKTHKDLSKMFKTPTAGTYQVSLQVRDSKGAYSEWFTQTITILPNQAPTVTVLSSRDASYAQGEMLDFGYDYNNESWESIQAEKWTYRSINDLTNNVINTKPSKIYAAGEYIVTLQLQDAYGNWGPKTETTVHITDDVLTTEFQDKFTNGQIGDTIDNFVGTNYQTYAEVPMIPGSDKKGTLIMSDSPEVVGQKGVLYEDHSGTNGRMLFHHINNFDDLDNSMDKKRLVVVATNKGTTPVTGTIDNLAVKGPSSDVLFVGASLLYSYLDTHTSTPISLLPGAQKVIYDSSSKNWLKGMAISGMFDYTFSSDVVFTVAAIGVADPMTNFDTLARPDKDAHPRGTFDTVGKSAFVDLTMADGNSKIVIGKDATEWVSGYDAILGDTVYNRGNFGVTYEITITAEEDTAVILNPRGNMFKGAIKWDDTPAYLAPNLGYFPSSNRATFLGVIPAGQTKTLTYMLPNGSSAPVLIGFVPKSNWND
ncbi:MAG: copper amine oxidase N-terminal domain-containing protein [Cellulosilyticaceae bacterium]